MAEKTTEKYKKSLRVEVNDDFSEEILEKRKLLNTTPDFLDLKVWNHHLLFVYGSMKEGGVNSFVLDDCPYLGMGITQADNWKLYESSSSKTFSVAMTINKNDGLCLTGEVYVVDTEMIMTLDKILRNGKIFSRRRHYIKLQEQEYPTVGGKKARPYQSCFTYVGDPDYWEHENLHHFPSRYSSLFGRSVYDYRSEMTS